MATLNKVMLIGRLTANPEEPRAMPSGGMVIKFRFAVGRSRKNQATGQWENDPNQLYVDCEAFSRPDAKRDLVTLIKQYAKQGDQLFVEGRLQLDEWTDKQSGQKRSKHKIVVDSIEFLGSKSAEGGGGEGGGAGRSGGYGGGKPAGGTAKAGAPPADDGDEYGGGGGNSSGSGGDGDPIPF